MFKELSQFICIYFFSTDYHLGNGRASPWGLYRGMKAHGPERLSRLSCEQRQPTENIVFFFVFFYYLSTRASTSCPPSTPCHCDCSLEWTLECRIRECRINDHENGKIVIGLDNENNNSGRVSRFFVHFFAIFAWVPYYVFLLSVWLFNSDVWHIYWRLGKIVFCSVLHIAEDAYRVQLPGRRRKTQSCF